MENIREVVGDEVLIIDTGLAVATHLRHRLLESDLLCDLSSTPEVSFRCSGSQEEMQELLVRLWDSDAKLMTLPDQENRS
jgi:glutamate racemase